MKLTLPTALQFSPRREKTTLLICRIDLEKNQELGKQFRWRRPETCPSCSGSRLWGHGYVIRYFVEFAAGLWMKRWRCPDCGAVHTARPKQYSPGVHYPKDLQLASLREKLAGNPFLGTIPRQVQQHWVKTFRHMCRRTSNWHDPAAVLRGLLEKDQFHLTKRRIYSASRPRLAAPYLPFALTVKPPHFSLE